MGGVLDSYLQKMTEALKESPETVLISQSQEIYNLNKINRMYQENEHSAAGGVMIDPYILEPIPEAITQAEQAKLRALAKQFKALEATLQEDFFSYKQYYVISAKWLARWKVYVSYAESNSDLHSSKFIGSGQLPQLNEDIVDPQGPNIRFQYPNDHLNIALRQGLKLDVDYHLVNKPIWELFQQYQNIEIKRFLQITDDGPKVEVYYRRINAIYLFNDLLKEVEREHLKKFKRIRLQLPQYHPIEQLITLVSPKVREYVKKQCKNLSSMSSMHSTSIDFDVHQNIKVWTIEDDMTESKLMDNLYRGCKANRSFSYKLFFPGLYLDTTTQEFLSKIELPPTAKLIIQLKQSNEEWVFYNKSSPLTAKCDYCKTIERLLVICSCGYALYCSKQCKRKDKSTHRMRCDRDAESSEEEKQETLTELSKKGRMGLRNLGNTCFMNSGIQCLTSVAPLTDYFINQKHIPEINTTNPLGTKGQLSIAFAKLIKKMWCGTEESIAPTVLKKAIGKFQPMFSGYEQHDSGELISYLLDGLHEDLNRVKQKPYVETKDYDGRQDKIVAKQSWENFLKRNQSIIVDLMYGQYRSHLRCPKCEYDSIIFDPFLMCALPIPQETSKTFELTYLEDHIRAIKLTIKYQKNNNYKIKHVIEEVAKRLNVSTNMVVIGGSYYSGEYVDPSKQANQIRKQYKHKTIVFRPAEVDEDLDNDQKIVVQHSECHSQYGNQNYRRNITFQRIYLFNKDITTKQMHLKLASYYKELLKVENYEEQIIKVKQADQKWRILIVANSRYDACYFCEKSGCENCPLPFRDDLTLGDLLKKIKKTTFQHKFELQIYWRKEASKIQKAFEKVEKLVETQTGSGTKKSLDIYDCFNLAQQPQQLTQQNAWYCPKCKDFVLATKQLKIYKAPKIFVVYFKRFKGKGMRGIFQQKLSALIDFPTKEIDITKYVLNHNLPEDYKLDYEKMDEQKSLIYQLFAISNHYGSLGGGHYTAYCNKNNDGWSEYDDSSVSRIDESRLASQSSYVLFFKRKQ